MTIKIAQPADLPAIYKFYQRVCEQQKDDEYSPKWTWQDYPSEKGLADFVAHDQVIINLQDDQVIAAGVLSVGEDPTYREVPWEHPVLTQKLRFYIYSTLIRNFVDMVLPRQRYVPSSIRHGKMGKR